MIRMLEDAIGNSKFLRGLRSYLERYRFNNTDSHDLFEILRNNADGKIDIVEFMTRWTKLPGFPVINVVRRGKAVFRLSQRHFGNNTFEYVQLDPARVKSEGVGGVRNP